MEKHRDIVSWQVPSVRATRRRVLEKIHYQGDAIKEKLGSSTDPDSLVATTERREL